MNKFVMLAFMLTAASTSAFAQENREEMNQEYAEKYKEIGTDPSLSGYEKGQKKRALALKQKQDNLNYEDNYHSHTTDIDKKKKELDRKIHQLEKKYKKDKALIDKDHKSNMKRIKAQEKRLEQEYKAKKEILKREKEALRS